MVDKGSEFCYNVFKKWLKDNDFEYHLDCLNVHLQKSKKPQTSHI